MTKNGWYFWLYDSSFTCNIYIFFLHFWLHFTSMPVHGVCFSFILTLKKCHNIKLTMYTLPSICYCFLVKSEENIIQEIFQEHLLLSRMVMVWENYYNESFCENNFRNYTVKTKTQRGGFQGEGKATTAPYTAALIFSSCLNNQFFHLTGDNLRFPTVIPKSWSHKILRSILWLQTHSNWSSDVWFHTNSNWDSGVI